MDKSGFGIARDVLKAEGETAEFPILCETCLGDNPYVRMTRRNMGKECKICSRPYTVFRWKPGPMARFKQSIICQYCAKLKNVCQTCLFDLEYGLPVQVRDKFLAESGVLVNNVSVVGNLGIGRDVSTDRSGGIVENDLSKLSNVNRDYITSQLQKYNNLGMSSPTSNIHLLNMARSTPYYRRNAPRSCTFWLRGECSRGESCPFLHVQEKHDPALAVQRIRDRYSGSDDPVAAKILSFTENSHYSLSLKPPEDTTVTTLFLKNIDTYRICESDINDEFYTFGMLKNVYINKCNNTAFVTFEKRSDAENAMKSLNGSVRIKGCQIFIHWAKPLPKGDQAMSGKLFNDDYLIENLSRLRPSGYYASMNPEAAEYII